MPDLETIVDLAPRLRRKEVSPVEVTRACLDRIEKLNLTLNAFITVTAESALAGARTTAASALYQNRIPTEDAEVVRRLRRAGAVILGKNNLHEFAYGGSSLGSPFGVLRNLLVFGRIAGGS